jgi:hypothetical protein
MGGGVGGRGWFGLVRPVAIERLDQIVALCCDSREEG